MEELVQALNEGIRKSRASRCKTCGRKEPTYVKKPKRVKTPAEILNPPWTYAGYLRWRPMVYADAAGSRWYEIQAKVSDKWRAIACWPNLASIEYFVSKACQHRSPNRQAARIVKLIKRRLKKHGKDTD